MKSRRRRSVELDVSNIHDDSENHFPGHSQLKLMEGTVKMRFDRKGTAIVRG